jgi:radical SAM superfamily enzyme YgiQ (UPF0313 family)
MATTLYLINPAESFPTYYGTEVFAKYGYSPAAYIADLATTTIAAMAPEDFEVTICDEHISPADLESQADYIGLTGKSTQVERMKELAAHYRARGKTVIIGGPFVSLCPDVFRNECDILVQGEMEEIAAEFFKDLRQGSWRAHYQGMMPDITTSPLPRWDLYPNEHAVTGCVQTSRGCPFECEFCDVIQYVGRKQRHKTVAQVIAELDQLYALGYRSIFLADDNFTVYRRKAIELLKAIRDWNNARTDGRVFFFTQLSIDTSREPEILQLLAEAGPFEVFIGIETPNLESLKETKKRQNLKEDLTEQVHRIIRAGVAITGGMIVGFDADTMQTFEQQYHFAMKTRVPIYNLGALMAPFATPLFDRMQREGRLISEENLGAQVAPITSNIIPLQMTQDEQAAGLVWLVNKLYHPDTFRRRVLDYLEILPSIEYPNDLTGSVSETMIGRSNASKIIWNLAHDSPAERRMVSDILDAIQDKPSVRPSIMAMLFRYAQIKYMYTNDDLWRAEWRETVPDFAEVFSLA